MAKRGSPRVVGVLKICFTPARFAVLQRENILFDGNVE